MKSPVVIKNKPKNIFQCAWHFLNLTFQEAATYTHTVHLSQVKVMSPLGLAAVAGVAVFLQGAAAGEDPEVILTSVGCSSIPFSSLVPPSQDICHCCRFTHRLHLGSKANALSPHLPWDGQLLRPLSSLHT